MTDHHYTARAAPFDTYLTVRELFDMTGIPKRTIYDAIKRGEIARFVPNGCERGYRIAESEALRWIESHTM